MDNFLQEDYDCNGKRRSKMEKDNRLKKAWNDGVRKAKFWLIGAATLVSTTCAFGQKGYNDKCNGSPAWLSSTVETKGATKPAATISAKSTYHGINQLDMNNVKKLSKFINSNNKYKEIQNQLKFNANGSVQDASWVNLAKKHPQAFTEAQEDFICQVYLPGCFQRLQKSLISNAKTKNKEPIMVSQINPAILSIFAHDYVKAPNSTKPFTALRNAGNIEKVNSDQFIKSYLKEGYFQNKALSAFHDSNIEWKDAQLLALCKKAQNEANTYLNNTNPVNTNRSEEIAEIRKKISPVIDDKLAIEMTPYKPVAKPILDDDAKAKMSISDQIIKSVGRM